MMTVNLECAECGSLDQVAHVFYCDKDESGKLVPAQGKPWIMTCQECQHVYFQG